MTKVRSKCSKKTSQKKMGNDTVVFSSKTTQFGVSMFLLQTTLQSKNLNQFKTAAGIKALVLVTTNHLLAPVKNAYYVLFTTWTVGPNVKDFGNIPSGLMGFHPSIVSSTSQPPAGVCLIYSITIYAFSSWPSCTVCASKI